MVQLTSYTELPENSSLVILTGKDKQVKLQKTLSEEVNSALKQFRKSDDQTDFLKLSDKYIFFVKEDQSDEALRIAGSKIVQQLDKKTANLTLIGSSEHLKELAEGILLSSYQFLPYFSDAEKRKLSLKTLFVPEEFGQKTIDELTAVAKAVFWARDRVNEPYSHLNAEQLAGHIEKLGEEAGFHVQVLGKTQIESLKMGGLLAVNKGSVDAPTFTIAEYKPEKAINKKPIILVGKGVVYDTGGLSLKPTPNSMDVMKSDMAGAACMAGTIYLAALLKLKLHLIVLIPSTDNRPGLNAYAPGDVITMYNGTTVEVLNTDAEGRMILADALAYANKFDPELVIDAATLTGAALRAIGTKASVVMGNASDKVFDQLEKAANKSHERIVRFPFWDDYAEEMKSSIADLKNIGSANAGMITAGKFLEHFVKAPYVHMDIAGPAWLDAPENYKGKGGTGSGIRLLYNFLNKYK